MSAPNEEIIETGLEAIVEPAEESNTTVVAEPKRYEWQPTDEDGRPIGGRQVILYRNEDEFRFKFQEMNNNLIRRLRQQTKENRLGISTPDNIADTAQRFQAPTEFKPRQLSGEERARLSRELLDEDTFDQAAVAIFEASTGINTAELRNTLTTVQQDNLNLKAIIEADKFKSRNRDYVDCKENIEAIASWMMRYDLAPVAANFQKAYDTLKESNILVTSIEVIPQSTYAHPEPVHTSTEIVETHESSNEVAREEIPIENQIAIEPIQPINTVQQEAPKTVVPRIPSGLNNRTAGTNVASVTIGDEIVYELIHKDAAGRQVGPSKIYKGLAAVNAMPSEEYKRRMLTDKGFTKKVEKLEADAAKRRRG